MHVARIPNATRVLGAPPDWDEAKHGPCLGLPIWDIETTAGQGMMSAWQPTPEELERLNKGASVHLLVLGRVHPPVDVSVGSAPQGGITLSVDVVLSAPFRAFRNRLCILRSIDMHEMEAVGVVRDRADWDLFQEDEALFFLSIGDERVAALWALIQGRMPAALIGGDGGPL